METLVADSILRRVDLAAHLSIERMRFSPSASRRTHCATALPLVFPLPAELRLGAGALLGHGDGTFDAVKLLATGQGNAGWTVALGDANGDGNVDALSANNDGTIGVLLGNGNGTFHPVMTYSAQALVDEAHARP